MKKRILALGLSVALLLTGLCGCGGGTSATKNDAELIGNTYVSGFPIVKEKETLKVMAVQLANHGDFDEMSFTTQYEEMTNIDIEWTLIPLDSLQSSVSLALASGNLPDVICILSNQIGNATFFKYVEDGTFLKLNDLIKQYGENIQNMFENYPESYTDTILSDGSIYSLPSVNVMSENHLRFPYKLYIRQTWLDNLNLEIPTTTEEFYNVLAAFREDDPNGNGQDDEVPFTMAGLTDAFLGSWGVSYYGNTNNLSVNSEGKVEYAWATEGCKKGLSYLNRLVNQESAVLYDSESKWQSKIRSGVVGAFYGLDKYTVAGDELGSEYTMIAPPSANDGSVTTTSVNNTVTPHGFMITKSCKNPAAALRWIDYFYNSEGAVLANYGADGDKVTKNSDGLYDLVVENEKVDRYTYAPGHAIPYLLDDAYKKLFTVKTEDEMLLSDMHEKELNDEVNSVLRGKYEPENEIGVLILDQQAAEVEDQYLASIKEYAILMINKFIKGEENVETGWASYLSELEKKGLNELMAEYQRIYDSKQQ